MTRKKERKKEKKMREREQISGGVCRPRGAKEGARAPRSIAPRYRSLSDIGRPHRALTLC